METKCHNETCHNVLNVNLKRIKNKENGSISEFACALFLPHIFGKKEMQGRELAQMHVIFLAHANQCA